MKKQSLLLCTLAVISLFSYTSHAGEGEKDYRPDSGLVGPGRYTSEKEVPKANSIDRIKQEYAPVLRTEVTPAELDKFFPNPCEATGITAEVFNTFKGTKGGSSVIQSAQDKLPDGKVLSIHKFEADKTEEGTPAQFVTKATLDNNRMQAYESQTTIKAQKSGYNITFKQTHNLLTGEKPKISLKEKKIDPNASDKGFVQEITDGMMNVAIYSNINDLTVKGGTVKAVRQKFSLKD